MRIRLSQSDHYPDRLVEVTQEVMDEIDRLENRQPTEDGGTYPLQYLWDTPEGRKMIDYLMSLPVLEDVPTVLIYM